MTKHEREIVKAAQAVVREYTEDGGALKALTTSGLQQLARAVKDA